MGPLFFNFFPLSAKLHESISIIDLSNLESLKNFLFLNPQRQINEESIVTTRVKLAYLKTQQSDLMDDIRELMDCFHSKMKQVEKLMTLSVALGPIAS